MKIEKIKNRSVLFTFHTLDGWDLNIHLIMGDRYNYIIDTGLGVCCIDPVKTYIKDQLKPVIVINTHYHWDHIWGNSFLDSSMQLSHVLCKDMILSKWQDMLNRHETYISGAVKMRLPDLVFNDELYFPEDAIRIFHTPGHTIDSISVLDEKEGILNAGDNIGDTVDEIIPSLDCLHSEYIQTLMKYKKLDFELCLSGHNIILQKDVPEKILDRISRCENSPR